MCIVTSPTPQTPSPPSNGDVVYLTGATGFVGGMILKVCDADSSISKVYTQIRDKNGSTGLERFKAEGLDKFNKTSFISDTDSLPSDVTLVILCAYEVKFHNPVDKIMSGSVAPILRILDQCEQVKHLRGICLVSTSYVQNPLPYKRPDGNRIPFALREHTSATALYESLVEGSLSWEQVKEKYNNELSDHHKINCYAFSKHIMEHLVHEKYPNLPICINRPSIVAPSRDGTYGHGVKAGLSLFMELGKSPILRFPRNEGRLDIVFVDDVAKDILLCASELAKPASISEITGENFHPVHLSTTSSEFSCLSLFEFSERKVKRFDVRTKVVRSVLRKVECSMVALVRDKRTAKFLRGIYHNFDPVMANVWDYEATHDMKVSEFHEFTKRFYAKAAPPAAPEEASPSQKQGKSRRWKKVVDSGKSASL